MKAALQFRRRFPDFSSSVSPFGPIFNFNPSLGLTSMIWVVESNDFKI